MTTQTAFWRRRTVALLASAAAITSLAACGASGDSSDGVDVTIGTFNWTAAAVETEIITQIADEHPELGVGKVTSKNVDPAVGWAGIGKGDIDVLPEVNLPNQQKFADENKSTTNLVSETYGDAVQGWFVPKYLVESGGAAEGLKSVDQLKEKKYADAVGGTLYDADPGWVTTEQNTARIKGFGLDIKHNTSSEAAELAELKRAYDRKKPILEYLYRPHWVFDKYDLVQLDEPNPYVDGAFTKDGPSDVAIPTLSAHVAARKDLKTDAPKFYALLEKFQVSLPDIEKLQAAQQEDSSLQPKDLAKQWIDGHQKEIDAWLA